MPAELERERQHRGLVPPALRAGSNRLFQVLCLYWSSPEPGNFWRRSRPFEKTMWFTSEGWCLGKYFTSCIVQSFRSRKSLISSPLWTP